MLTEYRQLTEGLVALYRQALVFSEELLELVNAAEECQREIVAIDEEIAALTRALADDPDATLADEVSVEGYTQQLLEARETFAEAVGMFPEGVKRVGRRLGDTERAAAGLSSRIHEMY